MNQDLQFVLKGVFGALLLIGLSHVADSYINRQGVPPRVRPHINKGELLAIPQLAAGETLFLKECAACHRVKIGQGATVIGDIEQRVTDRSLLRNWIRNNQRVLATGDPYFTSVYEKYNRTPMPLFPHLTNDEIDGILNYLKVADALYGY